MSDLIPSLKDFKISNNEDLVDITDDFFKITSKVNYSEIVKANNFSLLQGTHALELLNPKLDTFLLEKIDYSISQDLNLIKTTSIISNQFKSLTCWLGQNVSIPNSILSSEYIQQILESYTKLGNLDLINDQMSKNIWNIIVFKFSILLISVVKFILNLALKSQIYEEEDLNTNTMNLNWFFDLSNNDIFKLTLISNDLWKQLESQIDLNNEIEVKYFNFLKDSFNILQTLSSLESIYQWNIPLFNISNSKDFLSKYNNKISQLEKVMEKLNDIELIDIDSLDSPSGSFNLNAQIKFDNQAPPKDLLIEKILWSECITNINQLFNDCLDVLKILKSKTIIEFMEWLKYLENKRNNFDLNEINGLHIVSRILFFSFLNNVENGDNNLVFNNPNISFKDLFWNYLKDLTLFNTKIEKEMLPSKKLKNINVVQQIDYYLETISLLFKEVLFLPSLNPSRQRQFKSKEMKYWNLRQSETGGLEDYFKSLGFYRSNERIYPLTSIIIFLKLKSEFEVVLKSIELNLFKDIREYLSVFDQLTLISHHLISEIDILIKVCHLNDNSISLNYLGYFRNEYWLIYELSVLKSRQFEILWILGYSKLPKNLIKSTKINEELLFNLQWKQFNCINDPSILNYKDLQNKLKKSQTNFQNSFEAYEEYLIDDMKDSIKSFNKAFRYCNLCMNKLGWLEELKSVKSLYFENLQDELNKSKGDLNHLLKLLKQTKFDEFEEKYDVTIVRLGRNPYFPGLKITEK
jgi:hypothetical protein